MKFQHPALLIIGLCVIVLGAIALAVFRKKDRYENGLKAANSELILQHPAFIAAKRKHQILSWIMKLAVVAALVCTVFLLARPYRTESTSSGVRKRDIFLCMDTGFYLDTLNEELIDSMEEIVRGLDGDRFGISLYSSSSVLMVPLTDDYDYIIEKLEELKEFFNLGIKLDQYYGGYLKDHKNLSDELMEEYNKDLKRMGDFDWITLATSINEYYKQPFLVGDGLASCLYSFPKLEDENRSRVIILSTDNAEAIGARPICRLPEATDYCVKYGVTVFGLFRGKAAYDNSLKPNNFFLFEVPSYTDYVSAGNELRTCVEKTGGNFYEYGAGMTPEEMVRDISSRAAMQVRQIVIDRRIDLPEGFVIGLAVSLSVMLLAGARLWYTRRKKA